MGFWDKLKFWEDDDKPAAPSAGKKAVNDFRTSVSPTVLANSANPNKDYSSYPSAYNATERNNPTANRAAPGGAPRYSSAQASRPMQRYLGTVGLSGIPDALDQRAADYGVDPHSVRELDTHRYALSDWQQDQAELDYGIKAPDQQVQLAGDRYSTGRLTAEAYDLLTPQQKNAIKFNELLLDAVERDRSATKDGADMEDYRARSEAMFGTQGGSRTYAPNTLALLEKFNLGEDLRGQDLDEYLSLDRAFDAEEIKNLPTWQDEAPAYIKQGFGDATSMVTSKMLDMRQVDMAGALVERALTSPDSMGWDDKSRLDSYLGYTLPQIDDVPIGYLPGGYENHAQRSDELLDRKETFYQFWFDTFQDKELPDLQPFWDDLDAGHLQMSDEDLNQFFDYVYNRSFDLDRQGVADPATRRSGAEVRALLGMGG